MTPQLSIETSRSWLCFLIDSTMLVAFLLLSVFVLHDACVGGLWTMGNRRLTSFCDSLYSCFRYRMLQPDMPTSPKMGPLRSEKLDQSAIDKRRMSFYFLQAENNSLVRRLEIVATALYVKFGSGTVISIALGELPVILKGPRHMVSFLVAFALMQAVHASTTIPFISTDLICNFQAFPKDRLFYWMQCNNFSQCILYSACALYKLRKVQQTL